MQVSDPALVNLVSVAAQKFISDIAVDALTHNKMRQSMCGKKSSRKEIVLNLDTEPQEGLWSAAIRSGDLKLIWGQDKLLKQKVRLEILIATVMTLSLLLCCRCRSPPTILNCLMLSRIPMRRPTW